MGKEYSTRCKASIIEYLKLHSTQRFSASNIAKYMEEHEKPMNLATIYRNLEKMTESDMLLKYKSSQDEACQYQYVAPHADCNHHLHMQCRICGAVIHLECDFMNEISEHLMEHHGFLLECKDSTLVGVCEKCRVMISE